MNFVPVFCLYWRSHSHYEGVNVGCMQPGRPLFSPVCRKCPIILHEYMQQWSASQIPLFHCLLSPPTGVLAPADTEKPYEAAVNAKEVGEQREMD